jgi:hypothetical protein
MVVLKFEDYLGKNTQVLKQFGDIVKKSFNPSSIFTPDDLQKKFNAKWPSINDITAIGKQIILMPQNMNKKINQNALFGQSLFFQTGYRNRAGLKYYYSINQIAKAHLEFIRHNPNQLVEVGEDGTVLGELLNRVGKGGGQFTTSDINKLKQKGVNFISVDHLEKGDLRFAQGNILVDLQQNAAYFIPIALIAAAFTPRKHIDSTISNTSRCLIQVLVASLLPAEGKFLYHSIDGTLEAFKKDVNHEFESRYAKIKRGLKSFVEYGLPNALDLATKSFVFGVVGDVRRTILGQPDENLSDLALQFTVDAPIANTIVEGVKDTARRTYNIGSKYASAGYKWLQSKKVKKNKENFTEKVKKQYNTEQSNNKTPRKT